MDFGKLRDKVTDKAGDTYRFFVQIGLLRDYLHVGTQLHAMIQTKDIDGVKAAPMVAELRERLAALDESIAKWVDTF